VAGSCGYSPTTAPAIKPIKQIFSVMRREGELWRGLAGRAIVVWCVGAELLISRFLLLPACSFRFVARMKRRDGSCGMESLCPFSHSRFGVRVGVLHRLNVCEGHLEELVGLD